jgi:mono/diheme cytochrome c family protein
MTKRARRSFLWTVAAGLALWAFSVAVSRPVVAASPQSAAPATAAQHAVLQKYCLSCHTEGMKQRGAVPIALDQLDLNHVAQDAETWERVIRKVRTGLMPPARAPRPDKATADGFAEFLEREIDQAVAGRPKPGRTEAFHRLNRAEYRNAIRDLLGLDVDVESLLPADDASYGFDNIAGVLKVSPTLMERYLGAAQKISRLALGTAPPVPNVDYFRLPDDLAQDDHLPGLPIGTRGGTAIRYTFPADAEYEIRVRLARDILENVPVYAEPQQLEVSLDGERVQMFTVPPPVMTTPAQTAPVAGQTAPADDPGSDAAAAAQTPPPAAPATPGAGAQRPRAPISQIEQRGPRVSLEEREKRNHIDDNWNVRVRVKAGPRDVRVAFIKLTSAVDETPRLPFLKPYAANVNTPDTRMGVYLRSVEIAGPFARRGTDDSPSRRRIFICRPADAACARRILGALARRAYRRPVTDADVQPLMTLFEAGRADGGFDGGIDRALKRLLVSPEFLFRVERDPANAAPGSVYRISDLELASRLSFFLWSSIPDDELLDLAERGRLRNSAVVAQQVRRMVADERFASFVRNFAGQWLYLRNLPSAAPVGFEFPDFDDTLRQAFQRETELFFESIVREDRGALELLTANYTFLNERLARHYGIPNIKGSDFRRVTLGDETPRGGLLGQGSILTVTSHPDRTSPVVRGKWILENLLGTSPPPPPPNVPELKPTGEPGQVLSMRERMVQHRQSPQCASCHAIMDPIGLSLENFDGVGKWRVLGESGTAIDATGALPDGATFSGPDGLKRALLAKSDQFVTTLTEKLLTYALGRGVESYDLPAVRAVVRRSAGDDYRLPVLIAGIVESAPFQMRTAGK